MDAFKAHVEVQDLRQLHFIKALVFRDQCAHLGANVLRRRGFGLAQGASISAILARMEQELALRHGTVAEHSMQLADVGLRDACSGCIDDMADTGDVVVRLDQIIYLDRLEAHRDFAFLIDLFHLSEHEPVACQTVRAVAEVDLYVIVKSVVDLLGALALQMLHKLGKFGRFWLQLGWFLSVCRYIPDTVFLYRTGDSAVSAVSESFGP